MSYPIYHSAKAKTKHPEQHSQAGKSPGRVGLGIDTGGTQTRWALANEHEEVLASGTAEGFTALQVATHEGRDLFYEVFSGLAATVRSHGDLQTIRAGITGFGGDTGELASMFGAIFDLPDPKIVVGNDIEIAYLDIFKPGTGYLVYAGTGSIAAFIDQDGQFHRAGGHGYMLDDGGSGYWIAREALRHVWRMNDDDPEQWRQSRMACNLFKMIGGYDWDTSREFIYHRSRGDMGKLAMAVAAAAGSDPVALQILQNAGAELARLANAMCKRFGNKPVALTGRVQELHPIITETMRACLEAPVSLRLSTCQAHFSAARLAVRHFTQTP